MVLMALTGTLACAQASKRIYFAGYAGLNVFPAIAFDESLVGTSGEISMEKGYGFAGAIGFKLTPQVRIEGELSYLNSNMDGISLDGIGSFGLGGNIETKLAMLNVYYDFDFTWKKVRPFVGAGIGYAWHEGEVDDVSGFAVDSADESSGYAWQVGGGARYPISDTLNLIGAYRYLDGADISFDGYDIDYGTHEFRLGLSWDLPFE